MIDLRLYCGKKIAVMGLGKTGLSVARALLDAGVDCVVFDDDADKVNRAGAQGYPVMDLRTADLSELDAILWSPGIAHTHPVPHPVAVRAAACAVPLVSDIELFLHAVLGGLSGPDLLVITGTNGKSTTTALTGHVLSAFRPAEIGGNIGKPVFDLQSLKHGGTYVLELSSYQIELTPSLAPAGVILLNITPDHLARHGGMEGYIAAKEKVFTHVPVDARKPVAVIGVDTAPAREIAQRLEEAGKWSVVPVSTVERLSEGVFVEDGYLYEVREGEPLQIADLTELPALKGQHNHENAACCYALLRQIYGLDPAHIIREMKSFGGLPHRQYPVRVINGIPYINDSKATNADAAARALASYHKIYWILGGQPKEGGLNGLEEFLPRVEKAYLIGEAAHDFGAWLGARGVACEPCGILEEAVKAAHIDAQAGAERAGIEGRGVVLLSPACASWDQFDSYEHRGDEFARLVLELDDTL